MTLRYDNMRLSELEREAFNTNNTLALAILGRLEDAAETEISDERVETKYKGDKA